MLFVFPNNQDGLYLHRGKAHRLLQLDVQASKKEDSYEV